MPNNLRGSLAGGPRTPRRRLIVLAVLYLVQDIGYSFFFIALTAILRDRGASLSTLALTNTVGIVWVLKFLWAPLVDRFGSGLLGHYRTWLIGTQLVVLAALGLLATLDPVDDLPLVVATMAVVLAASGTQEIAINGYTIALITPGQRPVIGGVQLASASAGLVIGSGGALLVYTHAGWATAVTALGLVFLLPLAVLCFTGEPTRPVAPAAARGFGSLISFLRRPARAAWVLGVMPLYVCGGYVVQAVLTPMLLDAGWGLSRIAVLLNTFGALAAVLAGLAGGAWTRRLGRRRALLVFGLAKVVAVGALIPIATGTGPSLLASAAVVAVSAATACALSAVYAIALDLSRSSSAASDLTLQLSGAGALRLSANSAGLGLAGLVGYLPLVVGGALATLVGTAAGARWSGCHHPVLTTEAPSAAGGPTAPSPAPAS